MCDLRPLLARLFPELAARHQWLGWIDYDMVLGTGLSTDTLALDERGDIVFPGDRPPCNGNFFAMRTASDAIDAWRNSAIWRDVLKTKEYYAFVRCLRIQPRAPIVPLRAPGPWRRLDSGPSFCVIRTSGGAHVPTRVWRPCTND